MSLQSGLDAAAKVPIANRDRPVPMSVPRRAFASYRGTGRLTAWFADWDLIVVSLLMLADVRVFEGSTVASFTLYELFVWLYCGPVVVGNILSEARSHSLARAQFVQSIIYYMAWILLASAFALVGRQHSDVLQQAKNIVPSLPLVAFMFIKLKRYGSIARLANLYLLYCVLTSLLCLVQLKYGGPYFRPEQENNQYKLDFSGNLASNIVLGFSFTQNNLAFAILPGMMFSAVKVFYDVRDRKWLTVPALLCCALIGTALLLSESRGAVIWFLFGFSFVIAPTGRTKSFVLKLAMVSACIVLLVGLSLRAGTSNMSPVENTMLARYMLWWTSFDAMVADPYVSFLGDGMNYVQRWSWMTAQWEFPDAHNGWIDQALFFGIPALLLYMLIWRRFFAIVDEAMANGVIPPSARVVMDGIRASVLAYMGLAFFEPVAHAVFAVAQLFFLMSCGVALATLPPCCNVETALSPAV